MNPIHRTLYPEVRVLDAAAGLVEYVASDESIDSYKEVIRADGWRFNRFAKNAPFVDSHQYDTVEHLLGSVVDFKIAGGKLIETVKWAIDVAENKLAALGWKMTQAGYLKAVSVGFFPVKMVSSFDGTAFSQELSRLNLGSASGVRAIYLEQEQIELSACVIGANPNALAKSYKAGVIDDADLDLLSIAATKPENDASAHSPADVEASLRRDRLAFVMAVQNKIKSL
jgi:hypothetical protein